MILRSETAAGPTAYGRLSRLLILVAALAASFAAGYWAHGVAPAVAGRLAAWSERPAEPGRPPVRAELGAAKRAYFGRLPKGGGR